MVVYAELEKFFSPKASQMSYQIKVRSYKAQNSLQKYELYLLLQVQKTWIYQVITSLGTKKNPIKISLHFLFNFFTSVFIIIFIIEEKQSPKHQFMLQMFFGDLSQPRPKSIREYKLCLPLGKQRPQFFSHHLLLSRV